MRIAIDISQLAYPNTGVANYLENLVNKLVANESHEFILFFSSLRGKLPESIKKLENKKNVTTVLKKIPPSGLHLLWNVVHQVPIEFFVGDIDIFVSSDWTEAPVRKAIKATILYDLIVYKYPAETHEKIIKVQKKKLAWVKKECDLIFCISEATKNDAIKILGFDQSKLKVIYPGITI
ncbi:MAG: glycosyltransferase [Candidatus Levybacteria bacterium]|nr:glycosyltransferase [Candidatus Levybacteria bacterium]